MPKGQSQQPNPKQTKTITPQRQQQQQIKQQEEEEELQEPVAKHRDLADIEQQEQHMVIPSQLEESKLINSIDDHSSMLGMNRPEDDRENPWSFCLDVGVYDPLLVPDIPFEEDGRLLDLFDQTGFEDNIDMIFEGEGNLISMGGTFFDGTEVIGCETIIKTSEDLDKKIETLPKVEENSLYFSSSSPSSPSSITSLVSCQL